MNGRGPSWFRTADPNQLIMMVVVLVDFLGQAAHMRWWGAAAFRRRGWGGSAIKKYRTEKNTILHNQSVQSIYSTLSYIYCTFSTFTVHPALYCN
jgi:hypothetical protein